MSETLKTQTRAEPLLRRKWSRIGELARGAAISQANRERASIHTGGTRWLAVEMKTILDLYPDYAAIQKKLPERTYSQIKNFIKTYELGSKRHVWTTAEISRLRKTCRGSVSSDAIYAAFPEFGKGQLRNAAKRYGIPWPERRPKPLGVPVLDDVRQRAFDMNLSLGDLDGIVGGGHYFRHSGKYIDNKKLIRVVEFMGGRLTVDWPAVEADV